MALQEGDFVEIDFVGRVAGTNEIFDLTNEEEAKKAGLFNPKQKYGPALVIIGAKMVIPGVEKHLKEMKAGDEKEFDVKPDEAFGSRNPKAIKIVSTTKFFKEKINPVPGMFVTVDGMQCKVQTVSGGRVRVDFNHPLAGKELHYKLKFVRKIEDTEERIKSLLGYYELECETKLENGTLNIKTKQKLDEMAQKMVSETIKKWIKEVKSVSFDDKAEEKKTEKNPEKTKISKSDTKT